MRLEVDPGDVVSCEARCESSSNCFSPAGTFLLSAFMLMFRIGGLCVASAIVYRK